MEADAVVSRPNVLLGVDAYRLYMEVDAIASRPNVGLGVGASRSTWKWTW
jgi:hypothetical protein